MKIVLYSARQRLRENCTHRRVFRTTLKLKPENISFSGCYSQFSPHSSSEPNLRKPSDASKIGTQNSRLPHYAAIRYSAFTLFTQEKSAEKQCSVTAARFHESDSLHRKTDVKSPQPPASSFVSTYMLSHTLVTTLLLYTITAVLASFFV